MKQLKYILILACFSSCVLVKNVFTKTEKVQRLIDQKDQFIWTGVNQGKTYDLHILNNQGIWFNGLVIIDKSDTLLLKGFEKGHNHPSHYKQKLNDSIGIGPIFIWTRGLRADTVTVENKSENLSKIPLELILYKRGK